MKLRTIAAALFAFLAAACTTVKEEMNAVEIIDGKMTPEVLLSLGRLSEPVLSPDGKTILYGVSHTSIEENKSVRDLYVLSLESKETKKLTNGPSSFNSASWSRDGRHIYYLCGGQLFKAPLRGGKLGRGVKLTDIPSGVSAYSLSPDESMLLYVSSVHSAVEVPSDKGLPKAKAYSTEDLMYRHWDHWVTEIDHSFVAPLEGKLPVREGKDILGEEGKFWQLPNGPFGGIEQLAWSPDGTRIAYSCKKLTGKQYAFSTNTCIYVYDLGTGETEAVTTSGGYDTTPLWSPDGEHLAWLSMERDGYEADKVRLIVDGKDFTEGFAYNADSPLWGDGGKSIYFNALTEGLQAIYKLSLEDGSIERLTSNILWYDFATPFAVLEDGTLLTTYESMDFPTEIVAVRKSGLERLSHENDSILSRLERHDTEARYMKTVDGKEMLTWVLYPPKFDASKKYPVIEICLGGPQGTLSQGWSYRWNYLLMCHQGYIVVLPNRRGTTAFGQPWCEQISGDYIGLNMQDYLTAATQMKKEPYVSGVAACGASYGGYSVYYLAGIHGNVYDCFVAHAGIFNEEHMYEETEEMWFPNWDNGGLEEYSFTPGETGARGDGETFGGMRQGGSPWSSAPKARRHYDNSPHKLVKNWHTPILCIHGASDFRVPYDQGMAAFNSAQMMGVPSKLIVFPEENHWILQPQNALYWHRSYFDWLDRWMK